MNRYILAAFLAVPVVWLIVSRTVEGVDDTISIRIEEFYHHAIVRRHPYRAFPVVISDRNCSSYVKTEEIIYIYNDGFLKSYFVCPIHR